MHYFHRKVDISIHFNGLQVDFIITNCDNKDIIFGDFNSREVCHLKADVCGFNQIQSIFIFTSHVILTSIPYCYS